MDFFWVSAKNTKKNEWDVSPEFIVRKSSDLMIRGHQFYAIWDPEKGMWSQEAYDLIRIVDQEVLAEKEKIEQEHPDATVHTKRMMNFSTTSYSKFLTYAKSMPDN